MLTISQIEEQYPENLRPFKRGILREYLQYKILEIIFNSKYAGKLSFLGGTALRIVYGNTRFSEDLDFDNFGLSEEEFSEIATIIKKGLSAQGLMVEMNTISKGAFRCNIRLPGVFFENELSGHPEEKILIHIDTVSHKFDYRPDKKILNKFDVFSEIFVTPLDIILSQKFYATVNRKRAKGRDFFDIMFLQSRTKPNYDYLKEKIGITNSKELKALLAVEFKDLNFKELGRDVQPFLFNPTDAKRVEKFKEFIEEADLG
ncbi:MAG: nucleotidyl transferase AbiEii/AbiGii toxin family protein [Patescibacteria group bacterium]|nr:nucleotidyl transferase AbiEii/AbiGii toxin family protein [Patescibacteria group bacterium]